MRAQGRRLCAGLCRGIPGKGGDSIAPHSPPQVGSLPACVPQGQLSPLCISAAASASPQSCSCLAIHPPSPACTQTLALLWVRQVAAGRSCCRAGRAQPRAGILRALPLPRTLLEPPGWRLPGARITLSGALGVPREVSVSIGTGVLGPRAAPRAEGGARWPSCCASWGGARSLRVPWFLPQPWLSQAERCPGRWRVALLQLLPPPSPLPATAPLPKNPTGDNAS